MIKTDKENECKHIWIEADTVEPQGLICKLCGHFITGFEILNEGIHIGIENATTIIKNERQHLKHIYDNQDDKNTEFALIHINAVHTLEKVLEELNEAIKT